MTDRLYFTDGTHRDYLAVKEREVCLSCVTPNGDTEYWGYDEVTKLIANPDDRYGTKDVSASTDSPSQATEADATDDTTQPSTVPSNGRAELQKAMIDAGIDVSDISITSYNTDEVYRIETGADTDKSEGSVWRTWADPIFADDDGPGDINWHDDGYPDHFVLPYDALDEVIGT